MKRNTFVGLAPAVLAPLVPATVRAQELPRLRIGMNPKFSAYLPVFVGVDKGYFKAAGVNVEVAPFGNTSVDQLPSLIRGDIDMMPILATPAFFNGYQSGITLKLLASTSEPTTQKGYADVQVIMVRKDLWDSHAIRTLADLRGRTIDAGTRSSALHVLGLNLLLKAGLTQADVKFGNKSTGPGDQFAALANKAVDVQLTTEPNATALQEKGIAVKWLTAADVMPWFQDSYYAVYESYFQPHRDILQKFANGYVRSIADVQRSHGKLTPELIATISKWADFTPDVVNAIGGVPYFGQFGAISVYALRRLQALWISEKLVQSEIDVTKIFDDSLIKRARA
jgi:NitT/TauT family transport system substrate-binding protein